MNSNPAELCGLFRSRIAGCQRDGSIHVYCDGSVGSDGRAGYGVLVREFNGGPHEEEHMARVSNSVSSTQVELQGILAGLRIVCDKGKDVYFFVDSRSALESLNSHNPLHLEAVVECRKLVAVIRSRGVRARFMWIPSHVGLRHNERVDRMAKEATLREDIEVRCALSLRQVRSMIQMHLFRESELRCRQLGDSSPTMTRYLYIYDRVGRAPTLNECTLVETVTMRVRLGYRYYWECPWSQRRYSMAMRQCRVCGARDSHTLEHYVMSCPLLVQYRSGSMLSLQEQIVWFLRHGVVERILSDYRDFAPRM